VCSEMKMQWRETRTGRELGAHSQRKVAGGIVKRPRKTAGDRARGKLLITTHGLS